MASNYKEFDLQLFNKFTGLAVDDDAGIVNVLVAGDPSEVTLYSDDSGTSLGNPLTMTNGIIRFFVDSATSTVDLSILTASGRSYFLEGVSISTHRVDVDPDRDHYTLVIGFDMIATADGVVIPTGFQLINGMRVRDVYVHKTQALEGLGAGLLLDVGVSGDADGFIDGITASATGWYMNDVVLTLNTTDCANLTGAVATAQLRGVLLKTHSGGTLTATAFAAKGFFANKPYMTTLATTTNNIVYSPNGTSSSATGEGYIYIEYELCPTAGN